MTDKLTLKCPKCGCDLDIDDIYLQQKNHEIEEYKKKITLQIAEEQERKYRDAEETRLKEAVDRAKTEQDERIGELLTQIKNLNESNDKLRAQMLESNQKEFELNEKIKNAKLEAQKEMHEQYDALAEKAKKEAQEEMESEILQLKKQIEDGKKEVLILNKKLDQGSQQLQGEVQELQLEECLRAEFPLDIIEPVEKGKNGADIVQTVRNELGKECGKIVWESKNVKAWKNDFVTKLREDTKLVQGDISVLVSHVFGKDMCEFTEEEGVWLVKPSHAIAMARLLHARLVDVYRTRLLVDRKESVQDAVYAFVTSKQFRFNIEMIGKQYRALDDDIVKMKEDIDKHYRTQRKLIDELVNNTQGIITEVNCFLLDKGNDKEIE